MYWLIMSFLNYKSLEDKASNFDLVKNFLLYPFRWIKKTFLYNWYLDLFSKELVKQEVIKLPGYRDGIGGTHIIYKRKGKIWKYINK